MTFHDWIPTVVWGLGGSICLWHVARPPGPKPAETPEKNFIAFLLTAGLLTAFLLTR